MNIANTGITPTTTPSPSGAIDGTVRAAVGPEFDSVDTPVATDVAPADAPFAQVLMQRIAVDDAKVDAKLGTKDGANDDATPDLKALDATAAPVVAATLAAPSSDAKTDAANDAIGNDLAAQLALVSQWAGLAPQAPAPDVSSPATARASSDPLDVGGKLSTLRAAAGKGDPGSDQDSVPTEARPLIAGKDDASRPKNDALAWAGGGAETPAVSAQPTTPQALTDANAFNVLANVTTTHAASPAAPMATPAPTLPDALRQMVGTPAWSQEVGNTMVRMAIDDLQSAAMRLNPEHLGPLDVQVRVDNGVAHLAFQAAHADTRAAIEASRPVLEQMFAEQGLKIGDCAVGDTASRNATYNGDPSQANASSRRHGARGPGADANADAGTPAVTMRVSRALGMVDTFA